MIKGIKTAFLLAAAALLVNCVNVDMDTTLNTDGSGKGKLVYSWDPAKDLEGLNIDDNFAMIESNQTITVTAKREYDSEGTHYKEIEWTFEDINEVDLEGLKYTFRKEGNTMILRALFEEPNPEPAGETLEGDNTTALFPSSSAGDPAAVADSRASLPVASPGSAAAASSTEGEPAQGQTPAQDMESDEMDEMVKVMVRAALDGFRVKFQFNLPYPVVDAPGAKIDGRTATWEIPLKGLVSPDSQESYDQFTMIMKIQ
jgi:hypothetical protein